MKRFAVLAGLLSLPQLALAQQLGRVIIDNATVRVNQPVSVSVESNDGKTPNCGLVLIFGDGSTKEVRVGSDAMPWTHVYDYPGRYGIRAEGKLVLHGVGTALPCTGDAQSTRVLVEGSTAASSSADAANARMQLELDRGQRVLAEKDKELRAKEVDLALRETKLAADLKKAKAACAAPTTAPAPSSAAPGTTPATTPAPGSAPAPVKPKPRTPDSTGFL